MFLYRIKQKYTRNNITVVPTMKDKITSNSAWCASFKLVWDDFQYGILENNYECSETNKMINNLIKDTIAKDILSEMDYYKVVGKPTILLKEQIEKELLTKFNEKSNILDFVKFVKNENETDSIILYSMLKKIFLFEYKFNELKKGKFGKSTKEVEYFGIDYNSIGSKELATQVEVLFYNSDTDFSVKLYTKEKDRIILYRTNTNNNFESVFNEINKKTRNYRYDLFSSTDTLKIPNLSFNILKEYNEINGKTFIRNKDKKTYQIYKAMQTIEFELDRTGGRVKSEALMAEKTGAFVPVKTRNFNFDDTFYLFLIEDGREKPYLALRIEDIENFIN